jgi:hypothetical protein
LFETNETYAKIVPQFRKGSQETLNIFFLSEILEHGRSWAGHTTNDVVLILQDALPGGKRKRRTEGKIAIHEVGHWLSLKHVWGDADGCTPNQDDGLEDTPRQSTSTVGCPDQSSESPADTCPYHSGLDNVHNYMYVPFLSINISLTLPGIIVMIIV